MTDGSPNPQRVPAPDTVPLGRLVARFTAQGAVLGAAADLGFRLLWNWLHPGVHAVNPYALWMAPLVNAAILLPFTASIALGARALGREPATRRWLRTAAYAFAAAQPLLFFSGRIGVVPPLVLAMGIGVQVARIGTRHRFDPNVDRITAAIAVFMVAWAAGFPAYQSVRYRRAVAALPAAAGERPNVLLLILDTVAARDMSLYGYDRRTTPTLDSLARHGVVFDRAIAPAPWTLPSHGSMFTGWRADSLSARYTVPLQRDQPVVAEEFADAGYVTGGFVANLEYTSRASGLDRGFHEYVDFEPSVGAAVVSSASGRLLARIVNHWRHRPLQAGRKQAQQVNRDFLDWQGTVGRRPWFAFLNYYDAHDPYVPLAEDERRFLAPGQLPVYDVEGVSATDTVAVASARALYDAAILGLDRAIGALLDELRRRGALERTVLVITSDHGEEWGEQGVLLHGNSVYLPSLHVPLLIVAPGGVPAGERVPHVVAIRRLAATLLDLAGLPAGEVKDVSLSSEWRGDTPGVSPGGVVSWVEKAIQQPPHYPASRSALYSVVNDSVQVIFGADTTVWSAWSGRPLVRSSPGDVMTARKRIRSSQ